MNRTPNTPRLQGLVNTRPCSGALGIRMKLKTLIIFVLLEILMGCSHASLQLLASCKPFPETNPENIELLTQPPEQPHVIFAFVKGEDLSDSCWTMTSCQNSIIESMKIEAARIGAHAIILNRPGSEFYTSSLDCNISNNFVVKRSNNNAVKIKLDDYVTTLPNQLGSATLTFSGSALVYLSRTD